MNDPRSVFERAAKKNKQAKQDPATKEMSLSQRLDRLRGKKDVNDAQPNPNWSPSKEPDRYAAQKTAFSNQPIRQKTAAGTTMTPELQAARDAEMARRAALKTQATGSVQSKKDYIPADATAMTVGWIVRNVPEVGGTFVHTEWNMAQLVKCMDWQIKSGQPGFDSWGISQLDACHEFLAAGGYYETERHHRGQAAPKDFPEWVAPQQAAPEPVRSGNKPVRYQNNAAAEAEARKLSFDDLKKVAQSQFKDRQ